MVLRGARNESWIAVTTCLRSARQAGYRGASFEAGADATPMINNTSHLKLAQCANGPGIGKMTYNLLG